MTQESYEKLIEYDKVLTNAVRCDFIHLSSLEFCKIAVIYKEVFGEELTPRQKNCNTCRLNAIKKIGAEYFAYKEQLAKEQTKKRKGGRPKKIEGVEDAEK